MGLAFALLALLVGGCFTPLFKPTCDPTPILSLKPPAKIDTLAGFPRTETHVENGMNLHSKVPQPGGVKEMFDLDNEYGSFSFELYFDEAAAKETYQFYNRMGRIPNYSEYERDGLEFRLGHVRQGRSDPEGGWRLMESYSSGASARIRNLIVSYHRFGSTVKSVSLTEATNFLAEALSTFFANGGTGTPNQQQPDAAPGQGPPATPNPSSAIP